MSEHSNTMCKHLVFIQGALCGFTVACILLYICNKEVGPVQVSQLPSISDKKDNKRKIIGYLKRDLNGVKIYESFHRAWSEGGAILVNTVDDKSESMSYVTVIGVGDYVFNRNATPVHGVFIGEFEKVGGVPNCYGILNINSVEFLQDDPLLYKEYISK